VQHQHSHSVNKKKTDKEVIEGNFMIPDVYMKTKYGSIMQYNYNIKEQENIKHGSPVKPTDKSELRHQEHSPPIKQKKKFPSEVNRNSEAHRESTKTKPSPYNYIPKKVK